ncbi:MAG: hypothetical protein J7L88_00650, partial [Thermoplasmata archaeon]|nr:hypothetical protein [Thermoplasmata archaeon]
MATNNTTGESSYIIDPRTLAILLLVLGLILIATEAATPGFFIAVPGTIFLILGILGIIAPDIYAKWYTPIIVIIVLVAASAVTVKFYQTLVGKPEPTIATTTLSMVGKEGIVIKRTDPDDPT